MSITIGSNIAALRVERRLGDATSKLSQSSERLASGLRINRAADDAAGLAVSSSLSVDTRVYSQGIRNINDGISALSIAQGGLEQLITITTRQMELAEQAANGTFSANQRQSLDSESQALMNEFNRIVATTKFNGVNLLDGVPSDLSLQGGYGSGGALILNLRAALARTVGTGKFNAGVSCGDVMAGSSISIQSGDFNGDGKLDFANIDSNAIMVQLGNGDGTFKANVSFQAVGGTITALEVADVNRDGRDDLITRSSTTASISVLLANSNGTFAAPQSFSTATTASGLDIMKLGDFNGDGKLDMVAIEGLSGVSLMIGNGDGTFQARQGFTLAGTTAKLSMGDINGDGKLDFVARTGTVEDVFLGNGDGTFSAPVSYTLGVTGQTILADLDGDGDLDMINGGGTNIQIYLANSDGTFQARRTIFSNLAINLTQIRIGDFNGDGITDIYGIDNIVGSGVELLGNGNGTFKSGPQGFTGMDLDSNLFALGDFDGDGVTDSVLAAQGFGAVQFFRGKTTQTTSISLASVNLRTQQYARDAFSVLQSTLNRIETETGNVGAYQSRLISAMNTLSGARENTGAALSRIQDADVASESSAYVSAKILQNVAASVLAQANQNPSLALTLLRG